MNILLIEDDEALSKQIIDSLEGAGFQTHHIADGDEARAADLAAYDLVILDLMLPGTYGMDLLKLFRKASDTPIMILSARMDTADKVRALKLGADDYLTKPFWPEELLARVEARIRRPAIERQGSELSFGPLSIDPAARTVSVEGSAVDLTKVEFDILLTLAKRPGSAFTRASLVDACLDPGKMGNERTLDTHVSRLRKKLGSASAQVATVWGIGYRLDSKKN